MGGGGVQSDTSPFAEPLHAASSPAALMPILQMREGCQGAPEAGPGFPSRPRRKGRKQGWSPAPVCASRQYPACSRGSGPHLRHIRALPGGLLRSV